MNYLKDGSWQFARLFDEEIGDFVVAPSRESFILTLPSGKVRRGPISRLQWELEQKDNKNLTGEEKEWLRDSLSKDEEKNGYKKWDKKIDFQVDNRHYSLTCNPRTGDVRFFFPEMFLVGPKSMLAEVYPELEVVQKGTLAHLLYKETSMSGIDRTRQDREKLNVNTCFLTDVIETFSLNDWKVKLNYNPVNDVVMLHLDARTVMTHVKRIGDDMHEWPVLNQGKFKETVIGILAMNGIQVPED